MRLEDAAGGREGDLLVRRVDTVAREIEALVSERSANAVRDALARLAAVHAEKRRRRARMPIIVRDTDGTPAPRRPGVPS